MGKRWFFDGTRDIEVAMSQVDDRIGSVVDPDDRPERIRSAAAQNGGRAMII